MRPSFSKDESEPNETNENIEISADSEVFLKFYTACLLLIEYKTIIKLRPKPKDQTLVKNLKFSFQAMFKSLTM